MVGGEQAGRPARIFLLGMMGAGKSTVGRALSAATGWCYLDNDELLARETGRTTVQLSALGPEALHARESKQLRWSLARRPPVIVSVAASVGDRPADLALVRASGYVVYLRAQVATVVARIGADPARPWLQEDPSRVLTELLARREGRYVAAADVVVDVEGRSADELAAQVLARLRALGLPESAAGPPA